jgi:hypothetical protein
MRMRVFNNSRVLAVALLTAFSLLIGTTSCGDGDKKGAGAGAGGGAIPLGAAAGCAILAGSTITNTGPSVITGGDVCLSPGSSVTGFVAIDAGPGVVTPPGVFHITDPTAAQAQLDLTVAYNNLAGKAGGASLPGDISGLTFTPGIYKNASSVGLLSSAGTVTLNGLGDPNAVFIFQIGSSLTTATGSQVILSGGTQAKNVYWQVGSSATLGTSSTFNGNIIALTSITLTNGATLNGRALARNGAVSLDSNTVTVP